MPTLRICHQGKEAAEVYYELRGERSAALREKEDSRPKVVLLAGFACTLGAWNPQVDGLLAPGPEGEPMARLLLVDNRGVGRSSCCLPRRGYSIKLMARDVLQILEEIGWERAHIVGHSMGGMIAARLAALAPERCASLTLISSTAGGLQAVPKNPRAAYYALEMVTARTPEDRAKVDLKLHFMPSTLDEVDRRYRRTRRDLLQEEYVEGGKKGGIGQPTTGFYGQLRAVWRHRMRARDYAAIVAARIPTLILHGRHDLLAAPRYGEYLARRLAAPLVLLEGAHFLTRERGPEVNQLLLYAIVHGRRLADDAHRYLERNHPAFPHFLQRSSAVRVEVQAAPGGAVQLAQGGGLAPKQGELAPSTPGRQGPGPGTESMRRPAASAGSSPGSSASSATRLL